jgi:parvulin-like peptidyl-prolyl isomerase
MRKRTILHAVLAAGAALAVGGGALAATGAAVAPSGPATGPQWLLRSEGLWVSDRGLVMALTVKGKELKREDLPRRAEEQLRRMRERLVLGAAAVKAGLDKDPALRAALAEYRDTHLADLWVQEKVLQPASAAAKAQAQDKAGEEIVFRRERARLIKEQAAAAAKDFPAEIDEAVLAAVVAGGGDDAVVARAAGRQVTAKQVVLGMARVDHPSTGKTTQRQVALTVLEGTLERLRFAAVAEREGFHKRPEFVDDYADRALRGLAESYAAQKIYPGVTVPEAEVAAEYERTREQLKRGEEREIYEALLTNRKDAEGVVERVAAGGDFAAEVKAHSVGPTKDKGGYVGFVARGGAVPALDKVIAGLKPGQISPVVRTDAGFHVLRCAGVTTGRIPPLEEVRPEIERRLLAARRAAALAAEAARLEPQTPIEFNEARYQEILARP